MQAQNAVRLLGPRAKMSLALLFTVTLGFACTAPEPEAPGAETPAPADSEAPRVFFTQPEDGTSVTSPVSVQFGIEGYQLAPVPQGEVTTARSGMGHHHVGIDTECLPAGTEIPMANPWVHFGDGSATIEMNLPPGMHMLTLQLGDDLHRAIDGLCTTISVNVTE